MERLTREQFVERFPLVVPAHMVRGIHEDAVTIDRDADFGVIVHANLIVRSGVKTLGRGIVTGDFIVEPDALVYFDGIVKGCMRVDGRACLKGIFGSIEAADDAPVSITDGTAEEGYHSS